MGTIGSELVIPELHTEPLKFLCGSLGQSFLPCLPSGPARLGRLRVQGTCAGAILNDKRLVGSVEARWRLCRRMGQTFLTNNFLGAEFGTLRCWNNAEVLFVLLGVCLMGLYTLVTRCVYFSCSRL